MLHGNTCTDWQITFDSIPSALPKLVQSHIGHWVAKARGQKCPGSFNLKPFSSEFTAAISSSLRLKPSTARLLAILSKFSDFGMTE